MASLSSLVVNAPPLLALVSRVVVGHGVDDALGDLGAAGPVEEGDGPAVLLAGKGRELGAQGIDIEAWASGLRVVVACRPTGCTDHQRCGTTAATSR